MKIVTTKAELESSLKEASGKPGGFVPTMGALHEGHLSLVRKAREECGTVVVSVFVNPTQFNDPNDLKNYPRTPEKDAAMLKEAGTDIIFMPSVEEIYPEPDNRVFDFGSTAEVMEGASRPGHFNGVAQVVSKLFGLVKPDKAYFGEKDFQQVAVIKALKEQLNLDTEIVVCPTVREKDGLAMSSRNALLDEAHRKAAPEIYGALQKGVRLMQGVRDTGNRPTPREIESEVEGMINSNPLLRVLYFNIVNTRTLRPAESWDGKDGIQGCVAVQAGNVRLIDNIRFI